LDFNQTTDCVSTAYALAQGKLTAFYENLVYPQSLNLLLYHRLHFFTLIETQSLTYIRLRLSGWGKPPNYVIYSFWRSSLLGPWDGSHYTTRDKAISIERISDREAQLGWIKSMQCAAWQLWFTVSRQRAHYSSQPLTWED